MTFTVTRERAQWVHDMARARDGLPYAYGGAFTNNPRVSTDCSGLVLQTGAWYGGRTDWVGNRYGSTESFRLDHKIVYDLGFKRMPRGGPAALPIKPVMLVGLQHGGGGVYSHTACTLMTMDHPGGPVKMSDRGVDWESHGNRNGVGVELYEGARAWNDPLFHDFWYLDAVLEDEGDDDELADPVLGKMIREIHACLFNQTASTSDLATPGEGAIWQLHQKIHSIDGMLHPIHAERRARAGDLGELHRIVLAAKGLGVKRDEVTKRVYQSILADIERDNPEVLQRYIAERGGL
ncbi:endolysin [Fromanvirus L5]|uniref:Endolysin A n=1 Tax=Mycobacterium phage L5 TaxID=31757 RepID=ENLYS_BPML5|nr:endolysin [Fromanvirus L5]Q05285.1 RecName: Full=Endolysin A; AltName: Full=Gene 10 protein; AltName: Full=Gp10; AltName: Full=Lysis protein; AltName: Full=Lysozyme [Fromanvirus L5]CAA79386.1 Lysin A [Fromanvirus L5]